MTKQHKNCRRRKTWTYILDVFHGPAGPGRSGLGSGQGERAVAQWGSPRLHIGCTGGNNLGGGGCVRRAQQAQAHAQDETHRLSTHKRAHAHARARARAHASAQTPPPCKPARVAQAQSSHRCEVLGRCIRVAAGEYHDRSEPHQPSPCIRVSVRSMNILKGVLKSKDLTWVPPHVLARHQAIVPGIVPQDSGRPEPPWPTIHIVCSVLTRGKHGFCERLQLPTDTPTAFARASLFIRKRCHAGGFPSEIDRWLPFTAGRYALALSCGRNG
eukprot:gene8369-biopygen16623